MLGRSGNPRAEAESREVAPGIVMVRAVCLIENKNDPRAGFTKKLGDLFIDGIDPGSRVDNEDDGVGRVHGDAGFDCDLIGKAVVIEGADTACVDEFAGKVGA